MQNLISGVRVLVCSPCNWYAQLSPPPSSLRVIYKLNDIVLHSFENMLPVSIIQAVCMFANAT